MFRFKPYEEKRQIMELQLKRTRRYIKQLTGRAKRLSRDLELLEFRAFKRAQREKLKAENGQEAAEKTTP